MKLVASLATSSTDSVNGIAAVQVATPTPNTETVVCNKKERYIPDALSSRGLKCINAEAVFLATPVDDSKSNGYVE